MVLLIAVVTLVVGYALKVLCCGTLPYPFIWLCPVPHPHGFPAPSAVPLRLFIVRGLFDWHPGLRCDLSLRWTGH